jgi:hypothetical protein
MSCIKGLLYDWVDLRGILLSPISRRRFAVKRIYSHTERPQGAIDCCAFANFGGNVAATVQALCPHCLDWALRMPKCPQVLHLHGTRQSAHFITTVSLYWGNLKIRDAIGGHAYPNLAVASS